MFPTFYSGAERQPQQLPQGRNTSLAASAAAANSQHRLAASGGSQSQQLPAHNNHPPFGSSSGQAGGARGAGRGERRGGLLPSWSSRLIGGGGSRVGEGEAGSNSASSNSRAYGSSNVGSGGGDGGAGDAEDSEVGRDQARILFYHKPTLANVPTGDVPDAVPVYLGCPNGGMALGLPLNESWQGGAQQVVRVFGALFVRGYVRFSVFFFCNFPAVGGKSHMRPVKEDVFCDLGANPSGAKVG